MDWLQVVILALVQALTEFLPISSSAHLVLVRWLLGWEDPGLFFDVALHFGTVLALLAYFARTWVRLAGLAAGRRVLEPDPGDPDCDLYENPRLLWFLVAATVPAGVAGLGLQDVIEEHLREPVVIGAMLIAVGCVIWWAERSRRLDRGLEALPFGGALAIGSAQALALVPGTSRAGITIAVGLFLGLRRQAAARFSFLLATPVVVGAALMTALDTLGSSPPSTEESLFLALGVAVSAVAGYAVIALFLQYLQRSTMVPFVYYRWAFGIIVLILASGSGSAEGVANFGQSP